MSARTALLRLDLASAMLVGIALLASDARADDTDTCIAASEQAVSLHRAGKLVAETKALADCAVATCPEPVRVSCQGRVDAARRALPSVVLAVRDASGHDIPVVSVTLDGAPYAAPLTQAFSVDPGEHDVRVEAAGYAPAALRFEAQAGEQNRPLVVTPSPLPAAVTAPVVHEPEPQRPDGGRGQRTLGFVVGGAGAAGVVVGAIFGALSIAAHSDYEKSCGGSVGAPAGQCTAAGVNGESDAATKGTISTVAFVVGGAALATGALLLLTVPAPAETTTRVGIGPSGVVLRGQF